MTWRSRIKTFIPQNALVASAALALAHRGASVFMFHRILDRGEVCYHAEMVTSTDLFGDFVQWLVREFDVVPMAEIAQRLHDGRSLRRACAITFDDGWVDNYTRAFPILRQFGASATIFLASGFIGSRRRLWQERLWYLLRGIPAPAFSEVAKNWQSEYDAVEPCPMNSNFEEWRTFLMRLGSERAEDFVGRLERVAPGGTIPGERVFMNWNEVREMHGVGTEFGAHTVNHVLLPSANASTAQSEIEQSRVDIEAQISGRIAGFAYPWGAVNAAVRQAVQHAGYAFATGVQAGLVRTNTDLFELPRMFISDSVLRYKDSFSGTHTAVYLAVKSMSQGFAAEY